MLKFLLPPRWRCGKVGLGQCIQPTMLPVTHLCRKHGAKFRGFGRRERGNEKKKHSGSVCPMVLEVEKPSIWVMVYWLRPRVPPHRARPGGQPKGTSTAVHSRSHLKSLSARTSRFRFLYFLLFSCRGRGEDKRKAAHAAKRSTRSETQHTPGTPNREKGLVVEQSTR